ncbi:DNA mismatch repair protein MutS [Sedimentibacter sp. zth1]|uniref:DNA mismatch repair protein MutS n=1 Tax=Sedimentibacter sp. zth1 TaxID=2816908 RepID=UPI001A91E289|nr:DNA mismatch repair protein MutS [Sedimentibacter sp. zth1]QSX06506.1 DNA mismatch repair protein MutS [Sedimentibacter sp. zth1]
MGCKVTPMMQQYLDLKENYKDCIVLYRLGDFYEMFFDDALVASKVLEIALTGRDCGLEERAPMCGVPHHAIDNYIPKLIENGLKVAICEQMEDPATAKGIIKRDVIRVVTPGTITDQNMLDDKSNNYLLCIYKVNNGFGLAYVDVSTGDLLVTEYDEVNTAVLTDALIGEIIKINPSEIISNCLIQNNIVNNKINCINKINNFEEYKHLILKHFNIVSLDVFGISDNKNSIMSLGMLIEYLYSTQKISLDHINKVQNYKIGDYVLLDSSTRKNLELSETIRGKKGQGTLYHVLDYTMTAMGGRLLKKWIEEPLRNKIFINERLDATSELYENVLVSNNIKEYMKKIYDIERLIGRIVYGNCNGRDLIALKQSISNLPDFKSELSFTECKVIKDIYEKFDVLEDIFDLLDKSIIEEPPISVKEGGIIKSGFNAELDEIKEVSINGKAWISNLQNTERERTGIKNLKIGYNRIFGYFIEITKSNIKNAPDYYTRKQTLANCERFVTPELKEMESKILNADEQIMKLEYNLFLEVRQYIKEQITRIQNTAHNIAIIDTINSLSIAAVKNNYVRPNINTSNHINIIDGRHPVIEKIIKNEMFVPNDTHIDNNKLRMSIITGPNMAGKSTYMRQVALIALMAHVGSFVPAKEADICIVDKIFTRVGASDDLAQGQSTFMVEMSEVSNILNNATKNSLLILDEIGRGTSTYDGLSIAWSVVEFITKNIGAKTLFATHYHELSELEEKLDCIKNYRILIKESGDKITFLRKIAEGSVDKSYGIQVANLAGLPKEVINRAKEILNQLEENDINKSLIEHLDVNTSCANSINRIEEDVNINNVNENSTQISIFGDIPVPKLSDSYKNFVDKEIKNIDINLLTPMEAMMILNNIIKKSKKIK